jgi:putative DNA primase/helicase
MDYIGKFQEIDFECGEDYPHNDIGITKLFYDIHSCCIRFVIEAKCWYVYNGQRWKKDEGGYQVMEMFKDFVQAFQSYAKINFLPNEKLIKYANGLAGCKRRKELLFDARSISPVSLSEFDRDKYLLNCKNGTFNLKDFKLQAHQAEDYITKIARVKYDEKAKCQRWERFINEVMCGDTDTAAFLQKSAGYALSGDTDLEVFFIYYGNSTRNGKSTLTETIGYIFGDYARSIQPQTLSRRSTDGASPSPDIARLKGARLVNMPEPQRGLELNIALIKQLTGGDTFTGRFLNENPVEFTPEFKIYINTNHLPRTSDDTIFSSGRVKLIPFDRHFAPNEQDTGLKKLFRRSVNKSAILNWLLEGYWNLQKDGLAVPLRVEQTIAAYRQESDVIGEFLSDSTIELAGSRLPTAELYVHYANWTKDNGYKPLNSKNFIAELRRRLDIRRDGSVGNVVVGLALCADQGQR